MTCLVRIPSVGALVALWSLTGSVARADLVTSITGQYGAVNPSSGDNMTVFTLTEGTVSAPASLMGDNASDLSVNVMQYGVAGSTDVTLSPTFTITQSLIPLNQPPGVLLGSATWDVTNPATLFPNDPTNGIGTITADLTLESGQSLPGVDLSRLSSAVLTVDFAGIQVNAPSDGTATWPFPPHSTVGATFTLTPLNPAVVPEPGALVAWLLVVLTGGGWLWFRRRQRRAA